MPEPVKEPVVDDDEKELRTELEADGELLDDSGKPLPWNHPKRVRLIYKEAKEGRKVSGVLKEIGLKPSDLPKAIERLQQFETAYAEWEEEQAEGKTTDTEDAEAVEARKQADKIVKQLKSLGFKHKSETDDEGEAKRAEEHKTKTVLAARERITDLLEEAGLLTDKMSDEDKADLVDEFDFKVGQRLQRDKEGVASFVSGSLRPIEKIAKQLLEGVKSTKPSGIKNLPPRLGGSSFGGAEKGKKPDQPEPKNIKEAASQMAEDLRARRRERET